MAMFDGIKVFSATKQRERDQLGDTATRWIAANQEKLEVVDKELTQSSDNEYHCLTIVLFYKLKQAHG